MSEPVIRVVKVYSYLAAIRPLVLAYMNEQVTRKEFFERVYLLRSYR